MRWAKIFTPVNASPGDVNLQLMPISYVKNGDFLTGNLNEEDSRCRVPLFDHLGCPGNSPDVRSGRPTSSFHAPIRVSASYINIKERVAGLGIDSLRSKPSRLEPTTTRS